MTTFQKAKNRSIPKGLTHDFCRKMQNFLLLFLNQMSLEIMFHYVLDKKKLFRVKKKNFLSLFLGQNESRNSLSQCSK